MQSDITQSATCRKNISILIDLVKDNPGDDAHFEDALDGLRQMTNCERSPLCVGCPFDDPCVLETEQAGIWMAEKRGIACLDTLTNAQVVRLGQLNTALEELQATCTCPTHAVFNAWDEDAWEVRTFGGHNAN